MRSLTRARHAIASVRAPANPLAANSFCAAAMIRSRVRFKSRCRAICLAPSLLCGCLIIFCIHLIRKEPSSLAIQGDRISVAGLDHLLGREECPVDNTHVDVQAVIVTFSSWRLYHGRKTVGQIFVNHRGLGDAPEGS